MSLAEQLTLGFFLKKRSKNKEKERQSMEITKYNIFTSFHKSTGNGTKQEAKAFTTQAVQRWYLHNTRRYRALDKEQYCYSNIEKNRSKFNLYIPNESTNKNITFNFKKWFNAQFDKSFIDEYNKGKKPSRQIKKYDVLSFYEKREGQRQALAEQLIISLGDGDNIGKLNKEMLKSNNTTMRDDWIKAMRLYHAQLNAKIKQVVPEFKVFNSALHLDETTPHVHLIGSTISYDKDCKKGLKQKLSSSNIWTIDKLQEVHMVLRQYHKWFTMMILNNFCKKYNLNIEFNHVLENRADYYNEKQQSIDNKQVHNIISNLKDISADDKLALLKSLINDKDSMAAFRKDKEDKLKAKEQQQKQQKEQRYYRRDDYDDREM